MTPMIPTDPYFGFQHGACPIATGVVVDGATERHGRIVIHSRSTAIAAGLLCWANQLRRCDQRTLRGPRSTGTGSACPVWMMCRPLLS